MADGLDATGGPSTSNCKRKATALSLEAAAAAAEEEEDDIEEMERELADLDRRVIEYRQRHTRRLLDNVASHLAALRPPAGLDVPTVLNLSIAENNEELIEKVKIIKTKHEATAAALDKILGTVNELIAESVNLESMDAKINTLFKRKW